MNHLVTYLMLLTLTGASITAGRWLPASAGFSLLILGVAAVKFLVVAFNFMELRRAHPAWKAGIAAFAVLFLAFFVAATRTLAP